jgi:hypothetical protein
MSVHATDGAKQENLPAIWLAMERGNYEAIPLASTNHSPSRP